LLTQHKGNSEIQKLRTHPRSVEPDKTEEKGKEKSEAEAPLSEDDAQKVDRSYKEVPVDPAKFSVSFHTGMKTPQLTPFPYRYETSWPARRQYRGSRIR
jgi:hypothetical protein